MNGNPIRIGVVGCGTIAHFHLQAFRELGEEVAAVVALCDLREDRLEQARALFPTARTSRDFRDLLRPGDLDLVLVATMPDTHAAVATAALEAGAHVLCEKPFALNAAQAEEVLEAAEGAGRQFQLCTNMRYLPSSRYLRDLVASGEAGAPLLCKVWSYHLNPPWWTPHYHRPLSGGGVLASTLIHALDLAIWICGSPAPVSVHAAAHRVFPTKRGPLATEEVKTQYDVEDLVSAYVHFDDGTVYALEGNWCYERGDSMGFELITTRATLCNVPFRILIDEQGRVADKTPELEDAAFVGEKYWHLTDQIEPGKPLVIPDEDFLEAWTRSIRDQDADVVQRLRENRPWDLQDRRQLLNLQRLIDACYESARTGRQVHFSNSSHRYL